MSIIKITVVNLMGIARRARRALDEKEDRARRDQRALETHGL